MFEACGPNALPTTASSSSPTARENPLLVPAILAPDAAPRTSLNGLNGRGVRLPRAPGGHLADLEPFASSEPPPPPSSTPTVLAQISNSMSDVVANTDLGAALTDYMGTLPASQVNIWGLAAVSYDEQITQGLCEAPEIDMSFDEGGTSYDAAMQLGAYNLLVDDVTKDMIGLSTPCIAAIDDNGGDPDAATDAGRCSEEEQYVYFGGPSGSSDCRTCVATDTVENCTTSGACPAQLQGASWIDEDGQKVWYDVMDGFVLACAPDWSVFAYILGHTQADGSLPPAFDHANWSYLCIPFWDDRTQSGQFACGAGDGGPALGDALGEGIHGTVGYIRPSGSPSGATDPQPWHGRIWYANSATIKHSTSTLRWFWDWNPGPGAVDSPVAQGHDLNGDGVYDLGDENYGYAIATIGYGLGLNPYALRPDGVDATNPDDTFARDWVGVQAIKGSTTQNGLIIAIENHNRCGAWDDPIDGVAGGIQRCNDPLVPDPGWLNDGTNVYTNSDFNQSYATAVVTLASNGLPDPAVPGGWVTWEAGSTALADPNWDACAWPNTFTPDEMLVPDAPDTYVGVPGYVGASLSEMTFRFGKDKDDGSAAAEGGEIREVLSTNVERGFCPADATGTSWRTFENVPQ